MLFADLLSLHPITLLMFLFLSFVGIENWNEMREWTTEWQHLFGNKK